MKTIVMTNGCFDLLHYGHIVLLKGARQLGDKLVVALNSDKSVRCIKGKGHPIINQEHRKKILLSIKYVDDVQLFDKEEALIWIIETIRPDILVKGPDWKGKDVTGKSEIESYGGRIEIIPNRVESTSDIIKRIKECQIS